MTAVRTPAVILFELALTFASIPWLLWAFASRTGFDGRLDRSPIVCWLARKETA